MTKKNPAVHYQDVALEVPEGDLVDLDLLENSLYRFVLKNLVYSDIHETSLCRFVLKNWT